jgi:DNA recombination protein RmuC
MDIILIILLVLLVGIALSILYLNLKSKPKDENENKEAEEIANLKTEILTLKDTLNNTINTSLVRCRLPSMHYQQGVTKDMTEALNKS